MSMTFCDRFAIDRTKAQVSRQGLADCISIQTLDLSPLLMEFYGYSLTNRGFPAPLNPVNQTIEFWILRRISQPKPSKALLD